MNILQGHYQDTDGLLTAGKLFVEVKDGVASHAELGGKLMATEYVVSRGSDGTPHIGIQITGDFIGAFVPDNGECERVGMTVKPL